MNECAQIPWETYSFLNEYGKKTIKGIIYLYLAVAHTLTTASMNLANIYLDEKKEKDQANLHLLEGKAAF